jgi:hypothetical protein
MKDSDFVRVDGVPDPYERHWGLNIFIREMIKF